MKIPYFVLLTLLVVMVVTTLFFLMPWVSKKIEEPFQCPATNSNVTVVLPPPSNPWANYVEAGKQRYNPLAATQPREGQRAFEGASTGMGSLDTTVINGAPATSNTLLKQLNNNIRSALETVDILPRMARGLIAPIIERTDRVLVGERGDRLAVETQDTITLTNYPAFLTDATTNAKMTEPRVGYVEERLPPKDEGSQDAAMCEVNNMYYNFGTASNKYEKRPTKIDRATLCDALNSAGDAINALEGRDTNKMCGVCLKDASPVSEPQVYNPDGLAYNGIGGMFLSRRDKNIADTANTPYKPSMGSCAPGYFFVKGQSDQCKIAAQRLNCEEIQESKALTEAEKQSMDGTDILGGNCRICLQNRATNYVYYDPTGSAPSIRVRVAVPTGTGRTILQVFVRTKGASGDQSTQTFVITSNSTQTSDSTNNAYINGNAFYFTLQGVKPSDTVRFVAAQEFPHRPRGTPEVFYVGYPVPYNNISADALAKSLDCAVATKDQLISAQQNGLQVCEVGVAADGKKYTVRSNLVSAQNPFAPATNDANTSFCAINMSGAGVNEVTNADATGVWVYGIKPAANHLNDALPNDTFFSKPTVGNWYTYYKLTTETGVAFNQRQNTYYGVTGEEPRPNYRGICIQLERNSVDPTTAESIRVGVEPFITNVGSTVLTGALVDRLQHYSRNGRFFDSERIVAPRPPTTGTNVFSLFDVSQYWLWSPVTVANGTSSQSSKFEFEMEVPGYFATPTHSFEDGPKCINSLLYENQDYVTRVVGSACDGGLDAEDRSGCLAYLFRAAGGDLVDGTLSPNSTTNAAAAAANRKTLFYINGLNDLSGSRSVAQVQEYLLKIRTRALGTSPDLIGKDEATRVALMNAAAQQLFGRQAVGPCERVLEAADGALRIVGKDQTTIDAKCMDFLYRNTVPNPSAVAAINNTSTYPNIGQQFSGLNYPGGEYALATEAEKGAFPYRACQPAGSWAPLRNGQPQVDAVAQVKGEMAKLGNDLTAIQRAMRVFRDLHATANSNTVPSADQEQAMMRCYGISKRSFVTNCNGVRGKFLYIYDFFGKAFSGSLVAKSGETTLSNSLTRMYTYTNFLTKAFTDIASGLKSTDTLATLFIKNVDMGGLQINGNINKSVDFLYKYPEPATDYIFGVYETDPKWLKMVKVIFQLSNNVLQAKVDTARYIQRTLFANNDLLAAWNAAQSDSLTGGNYTVATASGAVGYGVASLTFGFLGNHTFRNTGTPSAGSSNTAYYSKSGKRDACNAVDGNIYVGAERPLRVTGCSTECCAFDSSYYTLESEAQVSTVNITKTTDPAPPYIVLLKDAAGVAAQKVARFESSDTMKTVEFLTEDVKPYIPYSQVANTAGIDLQLRLESAVGKNFFLLNTGAIQKVQNTDTTYTTNNAASRFQLRSKINTSYTSTDPIYTIGVMGNTKVLTKNTADDFVVSLARPTATSTQNKTDWVIKPAVNGAYAFVSIELANIPGYYLIAERQVDGTFKAKGKLIDTMNDVDAFLACWRLYPAV